MGDNSELSIGEVKGSIGSEKNFIEKKGRDLVKNTPEIDAGSFDASYASLAIAISNNNLEIYRNLVTSNNQLDVAGNTGSQQYKAIPEGTFNSDYYVFSSSVFDNYNSESFKSKMDKTISEYNKQLAVLKKGVGLLEAEEEMENKSNENKDTEDYTETISGNGYNKYKVGNNIESLGTNRWRKVTCVREERNSPGLGVSYLDTITYYKGYIDGYQKWESGGEAEIDSKLAEVEGNLAFLGVSASFAGGDDSSGGGGGGHAF